MIASRQMPRVAAVLLAVGVCVLPPRADGTIPRPDLRTAALLSHSAPLASSQSGLHPSSPAAVLTQSEAAVSGMCRNDPVNNFDALGLVALAEREADVDLFPVLEPTRVEDDLWVPQINSLIRGFNHVNAAGNMAIGQFDAAVLSPYRGAMLDAVDLACVPLAKVDDACVYCFDVDSATLYMTARSIHPYAAAAGAIPYALGRVGAGVRSAVASLRCGGRAVSGQADDFARWWRTTRPLGSTAGSIHIGPARFFDPSKLRASAGHLSRLRRASPDEAFVGILQPDGTVQLFRAGKGGITGGHPELVQRGLATPGQTLGFSAGVDEAGNVILINMSELNAHLGRGGLLPPEVYAALKAFLNRRD